MLILAFDTATEDATSALVDDGEVLGERASTPKTLLADLDALLRQAGAHAGDSTPSLSARGPGASPARGSASPSPGGLPSRSDIAGGRRLDARRARGRRARRGARRRRQRGEVFVPGPRRARARASPAAAGARVRRRRRRKLPRGCWRTGVRRSRPTTIHGTSRGRASTPRSRPTFGPVDEIEPIYVRAPDADRVLA